MADVRSFNVVDKQVGDRQKIREWLPFLTDNGILEFHEVLSSLHLLIQIVQSRCQESARSRGEVSESLTELRFQSPDHEISQGARRIEFTSISCRLQVLQYPFIDVTKSMSVIRIRKINLVNDVDDLTQKDAIFHVLIKIREHLPNDTFSTRRTCINRKILQGVEQSFRAVDKL